MQQGLIVLGEVLERPLNKLVNEAVKEFIIKRSVQAQSELEETLRRLKALRKRDPQFKAARAKFVEAEARFGHDDTLEGEVLPPVRAAASAKGPVQAKVRGLLHG